MVALSTFDLQAYLPQRYPFLFVDRVLDIVAHKNIIGLKKLTMNESFFEGHFPNNPIMPGVLILEAMAQTTNILANYSEASCPSKTPCQYVIAGMERVRFKKMVLPGDQLYLYASMRWQKIHFLCFDVTAKVSNDIVCSAQITSTQHFGIHE